MKFLKDKKLFPIILGVMCGILLLFSTFTEKNSELPPSAKKQTYDSAELSSYTQSLETKITDFLENIGGISNVSVILTVESSAETVYAKEGANSDYVIIQGADGSENVIPLTEISAKIRGIAVACDYGENEALKKTVIDLLASLFDVGANRISVISAT